MTSLRLVQSTPLERPSADIHELRAWLAAEQGRECRMFTTTMVCQQRAWFVELFNADTCLASVGHADPQVALGMALKQVSA